MDIKWKFSNVEFYEIMIWYEHSFDYPKIWILKSRVSLNAELARCPGSSVGRALGF